MLRRHAAPDVTQSLRQSRARGPKRSAAGEVKNPIRCQNRMRNECKSNMGVPDPCWAGQKRTKRTNTARPSVRESSHSVRGSRWDDARTASVRHRNGPSCATTIPRAPHSPHSPSKARLPLAMCVRGGGPLREREPQPRRAQKAVRREGGLRYASCGTPPAVFECRPLLPSSPTPPLRLSRRANESRRRCVPPGAGALPARLGEADGGGSIVEDVAAGVPEFAELPPG